LTSVSAPPSSRILDAKASPSTKKNRSFPSSPSLIIESPALNLASLKASEI